MGILHDLNVACLRAFNNKQWRAQGGKGGVPIYEYDKPKPPPWEIKS